MSANYLEADVSATRGRPVRQRKPNQRYTDLMSEKGPLARARTTSHKSSYSTEDEESAVVQIQQQTTQQQQQQEQKEHRRGRKKSKIVKPVKVKNPNERRGRKKKVIVAADSLPPIHEPQKTGAAEAYNDGGGGTTGGLSFEEAFSEYAAAFAESRNIPPAASRGEFEPPPEFDDEELIPEPEPEPYFDEMDDSQIEPSLQPPNNTFEDAMDSDSSSPPFLPVSSMPLPSLSPATPAYSAENVHLAHHSIESTLTPNAYGLSSVTSKNLESVLPQISSTFAQNKTTTTSPPFTLDPSSSSPGFVNISPATLSTRAALAEQIKVVESELNALTAAPSKPSSAEKFAAVAPAPNPAANSHSSSLDFNDLISRHHPTTSNKPAAESSAAEFYLLGQPQTTMNKSVSEDGATFNFDYFSCKREAARTKLKQQQKFGVAENADNSAAAAPKLPDYDSYARNAEKSTTARKPRRPREKKTTPANTTNAAAALAMAPSFLDDHQRQMQLETDEALQALKFSDERDLVDDLAEISHSWEDDDIRFIPHQPPPQQTQPAPAEPTKQRKTPGRKPPAAPRGRKRNVQQGGRTSKRYLTSQDMMLYSASGDADDFRFLYRPRPLPASFGGGVGGNESKNFCFLPPEVAGDHCYGKSQPIVALDLDEAEAASAVADQDEGSYAVFRLSLNNSGGGAKPGDFAQLGHDYHNKFDRASAAAGSSSSFKASTSGSVVQPDSGSGVYTTTAADLTITPVDMMVESGGNSSSRDRSFATIGPPILQPMDSTVPETHYTVIM